jgi:predicted AAA+ superfamily ATPase
MYTRSVNILKSSSFFLFGARGTGKSTLLSSIFDPSEALLIDLLDADLYSNLQANPSELNNILAASNKPWCIIDEVQKVPALLDIVHSQIEKKKIKFALTGSSARKLKRDSANMLGGRAFIYKLFPLTHIELQDDFDLDQVLNYGSLAKMTEFSQPIDKIKFLKAYVEAYLKEEVLVEQLIRKFPPFRRFLGISATNDAEIINYTNIAKDVRSDPKNIANYYSILEDTLLGFFLEPYHTSIRKRQSKSPKFYWFDTGVRRALSGTLDIPVSQKSFEYGSLFESFVINEINRLLTYADKDFRLSFIRVDDQLEVDLVIERTGMPTFLVEIKSTNYVHDHHIGGIEKYSKDINNSVALLLSQDRVAKKIGSVTCLHWIDGLKEICA